MDYSLLDKWFTSKDIRIILNSDYRNCIDSLASIFVTREEYETDFNTRSRQHATLVDNDLNEILQSYQHPVFIKGDYISRAFFQMIMDLILSELLHYITLNKALYHITNGTIFDIAGNCISPLKDIYNLVDDSRTRVKLLQLIRPFTDFTNPNMWPIKRNLPYMLSEALKDINFTKNTYKKALLLNTNALYDTEITSQIYLTIIKKISNHIIENQHKIILEQ